MSNKPLQRLHIPVTDWKWETLPREGGRIHCEVPQEFISSLPEVRDWDRVRFTNREQFREYDYEGLDVKPTKVIAYVGDLKLRS